METSQIALTQGLTFLAWATGIILIIITIFVVKLLIELSALTKNVDETTTIVKNELEPTLKELNLTLHTINTVVQNTDKQMDNLRGAIENILGIGNNALSKAKIISSGLLKGFLKGATTMFKLFRK